MESNKATDMLSCGSIVVYPPHGVGTVSALESSDVAGTKVDFLVLSLTSAMSGGTTKLKLPVSRAKSGAVRSLSNPEQVDRALRVVSSKARKPKCHTTVWSHAAKEYSAKIVTGDIVKLAEVVRDLGRGREAHALAKRTIYENAVSLMCAEISAVRSIDRDSVLREIEKALDSGV